MSVFSLGKNMTAILALVALLSLPMSVIHLRVLATVVVSAFLVRGALEAADGLAGLRSGASSQGCKKDGRCVDGAAEEDEVFVLTEGDEGSFFSTGRAN